MNVMSKITCSWALYTPLALLPNRHITCVVSSRNSNTVQYAHTCTHTHTHKHTHTHTHTHKHIYANTYTHSLSHTLALSLATHTLFPNAHNHSTTIRSIGTRRTTALKEKKVQKSMGKKAVRRDALLRYVSLFFFPVIFFSCFLQAGTRSTTALRLSALWLPLPGHACSSRNRAVIEP